MPPRPAVSAALAPFYHGVASGDPLSDRVIIWTRYTPTAAASVSIDWQVATDSLFASVVNSGTVSTDSNSDYTVKVDVTGLTPNTWYYYRFKYGSVRSITGRTHTLPTGDIDSIRLAFVSCSDFQAGYFNVYNDLSRRNDISAVVHLGDFYYEYKAGSSGSSGDTSRYHPTAAHDAYTLADYRLWESQYKLDQDLRAMLEQYPLIMVWDDHEVCNNAWYNSAENHNSATQGNYFTRKKMARKAYFEWNPIRPIAPGNDSVVHRNFFFGKLFNLLMLDTRLEGRDSSLGSLIPVTNVYMNDTARTMLGAPQFNWLKSQLSDTTARWKIVGQQVMVAPLTLNILGTLQVLNGDQWDGYPAERKKIFRHISGNHINDVTFITGDIHSSWANDLPSPDSTYTSSTGGGSVATEFVCSSVTSSAFLPFATTIIMAADPWCKYIDLAKRGWLLLDINKARLQGDYMHVSTISTRSYTSADEAQWIHLHNEHHLRTAGGALSTSFGHNPPLVSPFPGTTGITDAANVPVLLQCYPNPSRNELHIRYYSDALVATISLIGTDGRTVYSTTTTSLSRGVQQGTLNVAGIPPGSYILSIASGSGSAATHVEIAR